MQLFLPYLKRSIRDLSCLIQNYLIIMSYNHLDDISPWEQDPHFNIYSIQYQERKQNINKKLSYQKSHCTPQKSKRKKYKKTEIDLSQLKPYKSLKNYVAKSISPKHHGHLLMLKTEKLKTEQKMATSAGHKSSILETTKQKVTVLMKPSDFVLKKYERMKKQSKILTEIKMEDIFRNINDIQNPTQRQNISLPKIQLKM